MDSITYVLYARRSQDSNDRQICSIDDQLAILQDIAKQQKLKVEEVITESHSAKTPRDRKEFQRMIKLILKGKVQGILVWHLDRLARNPVDGGQITWLLENGDVQSIITPSNEYKPGDDILPMQIAFGMANQYVQNLSRDIKRGARRKAQRGWYPFSPPIGYISNMHDPRDSREVILDPYTAQILKLLFEMLATGKYSVSKVIEKGKLLGLRNKNGKPCSKSAMYRIFRNLFYTGVFTYKKELYQGKHEPLVSTESFKKVQDVITKRKQTSPRRYDAELLSHLVHCSTCDRYLSADRKKQAKCLNCKNKFSARHTNKCSRCKTIATNFKEYVYYRCAKSSCHMNFNEESLLKQVTEQLTTILENPKYQDYFKVIPYLENRSRFEKDLRKEIKIHKTSLTMQKSKKQKLFDLLLEETITREEYNTQNKDLEDHIASIAQQITQVENKFEMHQNNEVDERSRGKIISDAIQNKDMMVVKEMLDEIAEIIMDPIIRADIATKLS